MPKRKREDDDQAATAATSFKQQRVQLKLKTNVAKLRHAFKVAKGFERQKLSRRRKDAESGKTENKSVERIDDEVAALKTLDIDACATHHFHKTLCKSKAVAEHPDLPYEVQNSVKLPSDAATLNISARLCNSNPVQSALKTAVSDVRRALGVRDEDGKASGKVRLRAKAVEAGSASSNGAELRGRTRPEGNKLRLPAKSPEGRQTNDGSDIEGRIDDYDDRIAASSGEGSDEDLDVAELEERPAGEGLRPRTKMEVREGYDVAADLSLSEDETGFQLPSPEPRKAPVTKRSAFIPSLTMGGYISGSGSDIEDLDIAPKRNRRGQRARQQIWEQKFGVKAKHLQRQERSAGWDPKRGAIIRGERNGHSGYVKAERGASPDYTVGGDGNGRTRDPAKKEAVLEKPMHPSWEAAKKAKEKREAPVAFQGKRVTFD